MLGVWYNIVMKKILFVFIVGIVTMFFGFHSVSAQTNGTTPTPLSFIGKPIPSQPADALIQIVPTSNSKISGTTAQFEFQLTAAKDTPITLSIEIYDPQGELSRKNLLYTNILLKANTPVVTSKSYNFSLYGDYAFQIFAVDVNGGVITSYQKVPFTLTGASVPATELPIVNPDPVVITSGTNANPSKVTLTGNIIATKLIKDAQIYVYLGTSQGTVDQVGPLFGKPLVNLPKFEPVKYEYNLSDLNTGTTYYYEIRMLNIGTGKKIARGTFTTSGQKTTNPIIPQGQTGYVFNPDDPGLFGDYNFPTNIGEPVGPIGTDVIVTDDEGLVPCGKRSDVGTPDENCNFGHVIELVGRIIDYLLILLVPLTVFVTIYTGVQMIIHRGVPAELMKYKENLKRIGIGVAIMLLAWTIVGTIMQAVVDPAQMGSFLLLDILG